MIRPDYLKTGDTVVVVSTARKVSKAEVKPAIELFSSWGLNVQTGKNLYKFNNQFYNGEKVELLTEENYKNYTHEFIKNQDNNKYIQRVDSSDNLPKIIFKPKRTMSNKFESLKNTE